jgi:hypothetical protein
MQPNDEWIFVVLFIVKGREDLKGNTLTNAHWAEQLVYAIAVISLQSPIGGGGVLEGRIETRCRFFGCP